jgi:NAD(P)-dependent dehydrogenase (short-subunit alcohol dehydrogenase family)
VSSLDGRVVAIAGAGGSLGPHLARGLAQAGATLALGDIATDRLERIEAADRRGLDMLDPAAVAAWARDLEARFGHVDAVAHIVGGWRGGTPLQDAPLDDWEFLNNLLIRTAQNTSRAFHGALERSGKGRFVLMSARQAVMPTHDNAAYAAAKAAAEAWVRALAHGFAQGDSGATANIIAINALVTPEMRAAEPEKAFKTFTDAADIAEAVRFLLSDAGAKMNGQRLALHG